MEVSLSERGCSSYPSEFKLPRFYFKCNLTIHTLLSHFAALLAASSSAVMWCLRDDSTCCKRSCWVCISFRNDDMVTSLRFAKFSFSTASSSASRILSRSDWTRAVWRAAFCLLLSISHCKHKLQEFKTLQMLEKTLEVIETCYPSGLVSTNILLFVWL